MRAPHDDPDHVGAGTLDHFPTVLAAGDGTYGGASTASRFAGRSRISSINLFADIESVANHSIHHGRTAVDQSAFFALSRSPAIRSPGAQVSLPHRRPARSSKDNEVRSQTGWPGQSPLAPRHRSAQDSGGGQRLDAPRSRVAMVRPTAQPLASTRQERRPSKAGSRRSRRSICQKAMSGLASETATSEGHA